MQIFKKNKLLIKKRLKAFTLVESLVSIVIISLAIIGPLSLIMNSIKNISQNRERVIASYLAEEMIEYIKSHKEKFSNVCSTIDFEFDIDGNVDNNNLKCNSKNNSIQNSILYKFENLEKLNPKHISWCLFLNSIVIDNSNLNCSLESSNLVAYFSKKNFDNFDLNNIVSNKLISDSNCKDIYFDSIEGYDCYKDGLKLETSFQKQLNLQVVNSGNGLKIESIVYYGSQNFLSEKKYVSIVDYIYP